MVVEDESPADEYATSSSSHTDIRLSVLRATIAQQCLETGWHGISESSLNSLVDVLDRYLKTMSKRISSYTNLGSRVEAAIQDFCLAFRDIEPSCTLKELSTFSANMKSCPLEYDLHYPVAVVKSALSDLADDADNPTGSGGVNGHSRPDWMDEELDFPPIDQWLPVAPSQSSAEKQSTALSPSKPAAAADIIIGDDDEDISDFLLTSSGRTQPPAQAAQSSAADPVSAAPPLGPRKLKSISIVNGQVITTRPACVPQARLPVELKPVREPKISPLVISLPEKRKKDSKKVKAGEPDAKKQLVLAPEIIPSEPLFTPDSLKIKFSKTGKKDRSKPVAPIDDVFFQQKARPEQKTPPERREDIIPVAHTPPPAPPVSDPVPRVPSIKLKSTPVFAEAWKQGKKERSEKVKTVKEKKSDKDREREREIKRELERVKERELEAELQLAALSRLSKPHRPVDVIDLEPVHKKHKKHQNPVAAPLEYIPAVQPDYPAMAVPTDSHRKHQSQKDHHGERSSKKSEKKRKYDEFVNPAADAGAVKVKKELFDRSWTKSTASQPATSLYAPAMQVFPEEDEVAPITPPSVNPPLPKLTIPKLTLKLGGKDIKSLKSSIKAEPQPGPQFSPAPVSTHQAAPSPRDSYRQPPIPAADFYETPAGSPLDLSVRRPAEPVQNPPKPSKPSKAPAPEKAASKSKSSHKTSAATISASNSRPSPVVMAPRQPTSPPPLPAKVATPPKMVYIPAADVAPPPAPLVEPEVPAAEASRVWICPNCGFEDDPNAVPGWVACDECDEWYHWGCVGLIAEPTVEKWYCPVCVDKQMKQKKNKKKKR